MKILFIGQFETPYVSNTSLRARAMEDLGHEVFRLCCVGYWRWGGRWVSGALKRLNAGPPVDRFNADILEASRQLRPEVVFIEKGQHIRPSTLEGVKRESGPFLIHYTPDAAFLANQDRLFDRSLPLYDLAVTNKAYELETYRMKGAREILLLPPSYDESEHSPKEPSMSELERYACDLAFIGTYGPGRERYLEPLAGGTFDLKIWGNGWSERCSSPLLVQRYRGAALSGVEYGTALSCAQIGLGILSGHVPDTWTTRSVEIPACGTFMLAERTDDHQALFEEGKEAEFFGSVEELEEKARFYLEHEGARRRIAEAGRLRCQRSGYGNRAQMESILGRIGAACV